MKFSIPLLFILTFFQAHSQEVKNGKNFKYGSLSYLLSTPDGYDKNQEYPTIIFLHGGDGSNTKHHPSKYAKRAHIDFPFIVIAPSCNSGCAWSTVDLYGLLQQVSDEVSVDQNRVYLVGYSMGGAGVWANLKKMSDILAAASPLAPAGGNTSNLCIAKNLAVRVYHGTADYGYANSKKMIEELKTCGSSKAELISLKGKGHGIWPDILSDKNFYDWLLSNEKK